MECGWAWEQGFLGGGAGGSAGTRHAAVLVFRESGLGQLSVGLVGGGQGLEIRSQEPASKSLGIPCIVPLPFELPEKRRDRYN